MKKDGGGAQQQQQQQQMIAWARPKHSSTVSTPNEKINRELVSNNNVSGCVIVQGNNSSDNATQLARDGSLSVSAYGYHRRNKLLLLLVHI